MPDATPKMSDDIPDLPRCPHGFTYKIHCPTCAKSDLQIIEAIASKDPMYVKAGDHAQHIPDAKDTNPKDGIGATKLPLHLVPLTAVAVASLAHLEGACKYGTWNWRVAGVRASIYVDAALRHIGAWLNGEDADPDSGVPHLGHALACLNIIIDAKAAGKLYDDRTPPVNIRKLLDELTPHVQRIKDKHKTRNPRHYNFSQP